MNLNAIENLFFLSLGHWKARRPMDIRQEFHLELDKSKLRTSCVQVCISESVHYLEDDLLIEISSSSIVFGKEHLSKSRHFCR